MSEKKKAFPKVVNINILAARRAGKKFNDWVAAIMYRTVTGN